MFEHRNKKGFTDGYWGSYLLPVMSLTIEVSAQTKKVITVDSGGAGGARATPGFGGSEKG